MVINVNVTLDADDVFDLSTAEAAEAVLIALHGDEKKDHCSLWINQPASGSFGTPPTPPIPPPIAA